MSEVAQPLWASNADQPGNPAPPVMASDATLRDEFAAKVLQGFCANPAVFASNDRCGWALVNCTDAQLAEYAYAIADAMLKARQS